MNRTSRTMRAVCIAILALGIAAGKSAPAAAAGRRGGATEGFAGLSFRDVSGGHVVVSWIFPGPLDGQGLTCQGADIARPDLVVALNGRAPASAKDADARIRALAPGDVLTLDVRTSRRRGGDIPDSLDHEDAVRHIEVTIADRAHWTGTIGMKPASKPWRSTSKSRVLDPADPSNAFGAAVEALALKEEVATLAGVFTKWQADAPDYHALAHVRAAFADPFQLPEIAQSVVAPAAGAPTDPFGAAVRLARHSIDAERGRAPTTSTARASRARSRRAEAAPREGAELHWWVAETTFEDALRDADRKISLALGDVAGDASFARKVIALLCVPQESFYLEGAATRNHAEVMRRSCRVDYAGIIDALEALAPLTAVATGGMTDWSAPPERKASLPAELEHAVTGPIRSAYFAEGLGWIVIGGDGNNRYDLTKIVGVLEPGGDDEYRNGSLATGARAVVDLAGNDHHVGHREWGAAAALLGVTLVDDRAGDDHYEGTLLSTGAAAFGAALLLDRAGNDRYAGKEWSIGAAMYGAGLVVDLGPGGDSYEGDFLCEGVGGPRGAGAVVDEGGNDLYRANGPTLSAYGTPGVFQSLSQGVGFGFRQYAAGGVGMVCDLAGDDRYEAGEFGQGGAYYFALGVLWDAAGRDSYYGNRYGQGYGVHQAMGALLDDGGDDTYWSMTAASQGSGWDVGCGLLLDAAGNDHYRCDDLGQGGASQQAIGLHVDLGGDDFREASGPAVHGAAGSNEYHWLETGAGSLGALLDLGGGLDRYSTGRANDTTISTGGTAKRSAESPVDGIFVDR